MAFLGKEYKLEKQENFEEFIASMEGELSEDYKKYLLTFKPTTKLVKTGDTYTLSSTRPDNSWNDITFKVGEEFDEKVRDHSAKTTITVDGNTVTQVQKFPAQGAAITYKREFTNNELVLTITSTKWDGVARRIYKAV